MKQMDALEVGNKRVLLRLDFNVPLKDGAVSDDTRITAALPTIRALLKRNAGVIIMSHLGRPKGHIDPSLSLKPVAEHLQKLLGCPVLFAEDCIGEKAEQLAKDLKPGNVLVLENLRFHPGEEHPEQEKGFTEHLAALGDCYINDAFGTAHRDAASITGLPRLFKGKSAAGYLMEKEAAFLSEALFNPKRPFIALIGGAKISSKIGVLESLVQKADALLIGGAMAFTFLKALGINVGASLFEKEHVETAHRIMQTAKDKQCNLMLPEDVLAKKDDSLLDIPVTQGIPEGYAGVDIGPKTIERFTEELKKAHTVFWNGPMGIFEQSESANGTLAIAHLLGSSSAVTVVGGGDSLAALKKAGVLDKISHASTGGGASLELIEFGTLPGLEALKY